MQASPSWRKQTEVVYRGGVSDPPPDKGCGMSVASRLHVVGSSPRSGTTLIFELLVSCFDISRFGDNEVSLFARPNPLPSGPWASEKPTDLIHACRVMRWDPDLHIIYMQRDPGDVIVSQHGRQRGRYWCDFDIWQRNQMLLPRIEGHPRSHLCRYEDLVTNPDAVQAELQARFPFLRQLHSFSRFDEVARRSATVERALNGVRKISPDSVGKWRDNLPRVLAQVRAIPDLPRYTMQAGYEADQAWLSLLSGVSPDASESARAEHSEFRGMGRTSRVFRRVLRRLSSLQAELSYIVRASLNR